MNPPVVLCGNLIIGVHGPFLSLKTEKVPVNHFDSPTLFTIEPLKDIVSQIPYNLSTSKNQRSDSPCIKIITQWRRP